MTQVVSPPSPGTAGIEPPATPPGGRAGTVARRVGTKLVDSRPLLILLLILLLGLAVYSYQGPGFLSLANIEAVTLDASSTGILAVGMMLLMISGTIDLSIGGVLTMTGIVSAIAANDGVPIILSWLIGIAVGSLCGVFNGLIVTRVRLNALIVTLATNGIFLGMSQLFAGTGVTTIANGYAWLGQTQWLDFQLPVWITLACVLLFTFLVHRVRWFRYLFFVGGNERAARLSGINTRHVRFWAFVIMGTLAGLTGVLTASRLNSASISAGDNVPLNVITAAVLGGASLVGGAGSIPGAALAVFFIALIQDAMIIVNVPVFWQQIAVGAVLLLAVSTEFVQQRRGD